jgi:hypothetical protein
MAYNNKSGAQKGGMIPLQGDLPFTPDHLRSLPSAVLYSALFAPIRRGARAAVTRENIASAGNYQITYTGFRLDQSDLDIYAQILHMCRGTTPGEHVRIRTRELLALVRRNTGKSDREWLLRSLSRLEASSVEIKKGGVLSWSGSFIAEQGRDDTTGTHYIMLNPKLAKLFEGGYSPVVWDQRMKLLGRQLAQWLHGFVAGQRHALSFHVADLMRYAQSSYKRPRDFRAALDEAAAAIREAGGECVILWSPDNKTATFTRSSWKSGATAIPHQGG